MSIHSVILQIIKLRAEIWIYLYDFKPYTIIRVSLAPSLKCWEMEMEKTYNDFLRGLILQIEPNSDKCGIFYQISQF